MESFPFNFMECAKDLKSDTLHTTTGNKNIMELSEFTGLVEGLAQLGVEEELAIEAEEELEYAAMKVSLADAAAERIESSSTQHGPTSAEEDCSSHGAAGTSVLLLRPVLTIPMQKKEASCSRFLDNGDFLAIGTSAGTIEIYNAVNGRITFMLDIGRKGQRKWSCTSMCFHPALNSSASTQNLLVSCDTNGQIHHWHATSEMHLGMTKEEGNEIYAVDFHPIGVKFATAGLDSKVRIYDGVTQKPLQILSEGNGTTTAGHSNRVFAVKWHPADIHITLSGGWDNTTQVWDARVGCSVRSIYGTLICGDALAIDAGSNRVLTGSWRRSDQLQEWDYGSGQLIRSMIWPPSEDTEPCRLYTAVYGRGVSNKLIGAGGSGTNQACLFNHETGQLVGQSPVLDTAVYGMCFSADGSLLAVTTATAVHIVAMENLLSRMPDAEGTKQWSHSFLHHSILV
ncbi:unnamed protein product [Sphagnum troendelagicum]|uniref:Anaphase-promoting complex subunit 4 WD40 domain-containing protein n=1 Tax=Sphagnum troendelagicum TaxID=128251 RepID=A0ABP0U283_9BRYO